MPASHSFFGLLLALAIPSIYASPLTLSSRANSGDVIIQMFDWNWDSVARECSWIGQAGYRYVQVSPAQEHIQGSQWWTSYQAVSYTIQSRRGNRDQYKNMVDTCKKAGVGVLADVLVNHMAGVDSGTGVAGNSFTHYNYPKASYNENNFHYCGTPGNDIQDWGNGWQVQNCELANLADLKTEDPAVRQKIANHLKDLLSLGVAGFRIDAAKHVPLSDLQDILNKAGSSQYITQEVAWDSGNIHARDYQKLGDVTEFLYQSTVKDAFLGNGKSISNLKDIGNSNYIDGSKANVFVTNHDSERSGDGLSVNSPKNALANAQVFLLGFPYGHPTILSSFPYSDRDAGAPNGGQANCNDGSYYCQHRSLKGMVKFRGATNGQGVTNWVSPQANRIAFGRGNAGFLAINNADDAWTSSFTTSLADGAYCQVVKSDDCSTKIQVSKGTFKATIPARSSIAIHVGSKA